jgi:mannose-6-phosphate isomerase-like protein (cupin superfamily)
METNNRSVTRVASGEGRSLWVLGELYTFKVVGEDTDTAFALWEQTTPPETGPLPHIHHAEDESFYVLEGELEFMAEGGTIRATAGSFVYVPKGALHTFKNVGTVPARFLAMVAPAGFEKFFEEIGEPATDKSTPPVPEGTPDVERLVATAAKYNCEVPPPPQAH